MALQLADNRPPIPPADLILRVAPSFDEASIDANRTAFDLGALEHLKYFERALAGQGRSFAEFERILDFGCGCGRFLRHLGSLAGDVEIHGTDIDAEMIHWVRANIPFAHAEVAPHEPPLPYPDGHFDLVINHSVFTHLDERYQDLWLAELQRISRPGGLVLLTVEGQSSWNRLQEMARDHSSDVERWRAELETKGILFLRDTFAGSTHPEFYQSTLHAYWYVFEHWARFFEVAAYVPDGSISQDLIVLRRRAADAAVPPPIHAPRGEPHATPEELGSTFRALARRARRRLRTRLTPEPGDLELGRLRAGLGEQGNRISVIAAELRAEIDALRREQPPRAGD